MQHLLRLAGGRLAPAEVGEHRDMEPRRSIGTHGRRETRLSLVLPGDRHLVEKANGWSLRPGSLQSCWDSVPSAVPGPASSRSSWPPTPCEWRWKPASSRSSWPPTPCEWRWKPASSLSSGSCLPSWLLPYG